MTPGTPTRMAAWLESAWLARYLERQLDGEELAWFEAYLLDKPELLDMVDADNALWDTLATMPRERGDVEPTPHVQHPRSAPARSPRAWMALAASLVLGIGAGWFAHRADAPSSSNEVIANPARVVFDTMRGEPVEPHVERASSNSAWLLVEVAVPADARDVVLTVPGKAAQALLPSPDGFVSFLLPRHAITDVSGAQVEYVEAGKHRSRTIDFKIRNNEGEP